MCVYENVFYNNVLILLFVCSFFLYLLQFYLSSWNPDPMADGEILRYNHEMHDISCFKCRSPRCPMMLYIKKYNPRVMVRVCTPRDCVCLYDDCQWNKGMYYKVH